MKKAAVLVVSVAALLWASGYSHVTGRTRPKAAMRTPADPAYSMKAGMGTPVDLASSRPAIPSGAIEVSLGQLSAQLPFAPLHSQILVAAGCSEVIWWAPGDSDLNYTILYSPSGVDTRHATLASFLNAGGIILDTLPANGWTLAEEDAQIPTSGLLTTRRVIAPIRGYAARGILDPPPIGYTSGQAMVVWIEPHAPGGVVYRLWGARSLDGLESIANSLTDVA